MTDRCPPPHIRGKIYELQVQKLLEAHGYACQHWSQHPEGFKGADDDLRVQGLPVEVKGARPSAKHKGYSFQSYMFLLHKSGYSAPITQPIVILYCASQPPALFIIPRRDLNGAHLIHITRLDPTRYRGKWKRYLNAFQFLDEAIRRVRE